MPIKGQRPMFWEQHSAFRQSHHGAHQNGALGSLIHHLGAQPTWMFWRYRRQVPEIWQNPVWHTFCSDIEGRRCSLE